MAIKAGTLDELLGDSIYNTPEFDALLFGYAAAVKRMPDEIMSTEENEVVFHLFESYHKITYPEKYAQPKILQETRPEDRETMGI